MWKLVVAFVLFAALALYLISKGGNIDMGGEKHDMTVHADEASAAASSAASGAASSPASAASN